MALLGVGIFPTVIKYIKVNKGDNGTSLDVTFKGVADASVADSDDELDFLSAGSVGSSDAGKENNIRFYGINLKGYDDSPKSGDDLLNELLAKQAVFVHIASAYFTADVIKKAWNITAGTGIKTREELVKQITKQSTLDKLVDNLFTQFEALMKPVVGEDSKKVVTKFLRKSKSSNFPRLSDKKLDWNPFIAAADDSKGVAKLKFSKWEQEQGFDSNAQTLDDADSTDAATLAAQTQAVDNVFGS